VPVTPETPPGYDGILVATNHDVFDYSMIQQHAKLIVDSRGVYQDHAENMVKA
jgi:UDP-N-acetyl-D-glucosamine dehydrogenase